jgi:hypothetical protein
MFNTICVLQICPGSVQLTFFKSLMVTEHCVIHDYITILLFFLLSHSFPAVAERLCKRLNFFSKNGMAKVRL